MRTTRTTLVGLATLLALIMTPLEAAAAPPDGPLGPRPTITPETEPDAEPAGVTGTLDFGEVVVGETSAPLAIEYTNGTGGPVELLLTFSGTTATDFQLAGGTCADDPIADASACTILIAFHPTAEYDREALLEVSDGSAVPATYVLVGTGVLSGSRVSWSAPRMIGGAYTYTPGGGLVRTVSGTTQYLHAIVNRYDVPHLGIYYRRSTTGSSWAFGTRLNAPTQDGVRPSVASSGSRVYVIWSSIASRTASGTRPRALWFRRNSNHGASTAWSAPVRLTSSTGRIDFPRIAAAGANVYIVYTDAVNGSVKVKVSHDYGVTWGTTTLGTTTSAFTDGRAGEPVVAASGNNVAVAWLGTNSGTVRYRWSSSRGSTWNALTTVGGGAFHGSLLSIAMSGTRVAVGWPSWGGYTVRIRTGTTWHPIRFVKPSAGTGRSYAYVWTGAVALAGSAGVAVAFETCWGGCTNEDDWDDYRADVVWRESADNGGTWFHSQSVLTGGISEFDYAYYPSIVWPSTTLRYVMGSMWNGGMEFDNVKISVGTGTP